MCPKNGGIPPVLKFPLLKGLYRYNENGRYACKAMGKARKGKIKMMQEWVNTDDLQICRKIRDGVYEFAGFYQADENKFFLSRDKIITSNHKDSDGEWDSDAVSCIEGYYKSLDEMRKSVNKEDEDQIVAEILFETLSDLSGICVSDKEADEYLNAIAGGTMLKHIETQACKYEQGRMLRDDSEVEIDIWDDENGISYVWLSDYSETRGGAECIKRICHTDDVNTQELADLCDKHYWSRSF